MGKRLFVDMDGTLAVFKIIDCEERLLEKGYYYNLEPHQNVVDAVKHIYMNEPDIEVFILSAYLTDSKYALEEKNLWLDRYLPMIDENHRYFVPYGQDKLTFIQNKGEYPSPDDYLLDDYSPNLHYWEPPAKGIKFMNGINGTKGTWHKDSIGIERDASDLADCIKDIILNNVNYNDKGPNHTDPAEVDAIRRGNGR